MVYTRFNIVVIIQRIIKVFPSNNLSTIIIMKQQPPFDRFLDYN